jgi:hypothetical protein
MPQSVPIEDIILQRSGGDAYYSWDEWNWFYEQATGHAGPAPEERGFQRNAAGEVVINGASRYPIGTWKAHAFPDGFPEDLANRVDQTPGSKQAPVNLYAQVMEYLRRVWRFIVSGRL